MSAKYTVVLSSANRVSGSTVSSAQYYFNWSALPEGEFNMSFTFYTNHSTLVAGNEMLLVQAKDLGVVVPSYTAGNTSTSAINNGFLGVVSPWASGTNNYIYAQYLSNCPLYIPHRPTNNIFTINLFLPDGTTSSANTVNYVMTLVFEPLKWDNLGEK